MTSSKPAANISFSRWFIQLATILWKSLKTSFLLFRREKMAATLSLQRELSRLLLSLSSRRSQAKNESRENLFGFNFRRKIEKSPGLENCEGKEMMMAVVMVNSFQKIAHNCKNISLHSCLYKALVTSKIAFPKVLTYTAKSQHWFQFDNDLIAIVQKYCTPNRSLIQPLDDSLK